MSRAEVAELFALQQLDLEIERAMAEAEAQRRVLAADPAAPIRSAEAQSAKAVATATKRVRAAEETLAQTRERLKRQETRLYAGQVSAKDLDKAQQEIEHMRALAATQEDAVLAAMMDAEEAQSAAETRRQELAQAMSAREREQAEAQAKLEHATARLERLREERAQHAAARAPELLARYEAIRRAHGGRAVAEVRGGVCGACRVTLTPANLQRARIAADLPLCDNCGRILHLG